jgi:hypothetical protein
VVGGIALVANYFIVRATKEQADATLKAAQATLQEAKQVSAQGEVGREQAEIAQRTLDAQSQPQLFPSDKDNWLHEQPRSIDRASALSIQPTGLRISNVGNGAAILDLDQSSAVCGTEQGQIGPMGLDLPPVIAAGETDWITLIPQFGGAMTPRQGIIYTVAIAYHAFGRESAVSVLNFDAKYINDNNWRLVSVDA